MKSKWYVYLMVFTTILLIGCGKKEAGDQEVHILSAKDAYERMESVDSIVILDVRTASEYEDNHIPGAVLLPNEEIGEAKLQQLPVLDAEILVYCRSGNRSNQAVQKLMKLGYSNVYDFGGIIDWPYETEKGAFEAKTGSFSSFSTADIMGGYVDEEIFTKKKLTMVNVWATFCGPCLREMPELGELQTEYADKDVQIVGIVLDTLDQNGVIDQKQIEYARSLVKDTQADYTHLLPTNDLLLAGLKDIYSVPTTFFVDQNGNIVGETYVGSRGKEDWKTIIENELSNLE